MICDWDLFAVGKADIMDVYCSAIDNNYGTYFNPSRNNFLNSVIARKTYNILLTEKSNTWRFAAEIQLFEILFEYCDKNNLIIDETIKRWLVCNILR
jgi:hypothetical protein